MFERRARKMSRVKTKLQAFLTSVPDGDELSVSTPIPFNPGQIPPALTGWLECRVSRRTSLTWRRTSIIRQIQSGCDGLSDGAVRSILD